MKLIIIFKIKASLPALDPGMIGSIVPDMIITAGIDGNIIFLTGDGNPIAIQIKCRHFIAHALLGLRKILLNHRPDGLQASLTFGAECVIVTIGLSHGVKDFRGPLRFSGQGERVAILSNLIHILNEQTSVQDINFCEVSILFWGPCPFRRSGVILRPNRSHTSRPVHRPIHRL